jgi:hypothetical protein
MLLDQNLILWDGLITSCTFGSNIYFGNGVYSGTTSGWTVDLQQLQETGLSVNDLVLDWKIGTAFVGATSTYTFSLYSADTLSTAWASWTKVWSAGTTVVPVASCTAGLQIFLGLLGSKSYAYAVAAGSGWLAALKRYLRIGFLVGTASPTDGTMSAALVQRINVANRKVF